MQLSFSFRNKFIILHPCGLLVDNTFSKMCVFKVLTIYNDCAAYTLKRDSALCQIRDNYHIVADGSIFFP